MIVALSITSESSDHYLLLFKDKTVQEIDEELREDGESYYGASIKVQALDITDEEESELLEMLNVFREDSWNF